MPLSLQRCGISSKIPLSNFRHIFSSVSLSKLALLHAITMDSGVRNPTLNRVNWFNILFNSENTRFRKLIALDKKFNFSIIIILFTLFTVYPGLFLGCNAIQGKSFI